jgi:serine/threonine protein phosphatase PrpC
MPTAIPSLDWHTFHVPKRGHSPLEYEDAFACAPKAGRFAVADGASESSFASAWAKILVQAYVHKPAAWSTWLPAARKRWRTRLDHGELPWYAQTKLEEGAYAALLGVHIKGRTWDAEAVGDSCIFQVRGSKLRRAFPLRRSQDFSNQPNLLGSRSHKHAGIRTRRLHLKSDWQEGDVLLLMTDALAQWFLQNVEARGRPWTDLLAIETRREFVDLIEKLRGEGMRNDDVTLIRVQAVGLPS